MNGQYQVMVSALTLRQMAAFGLILMIAYPAAAQQPSPEQNFIDSLAALNQRLGGIEPDQAAIDRTDPEIRSHLDRIEQLSARFNSPEFPVNGIQTFESLCAPLSQISVRYILDGSGALRRSAGNGEATPAQIAQLTAAVAQLRQGNSERYQDEIAILSSSAMRCMHAHLPFITRFVAELPPEQLTPVRIGGLQQMRRGVLQVIVGVLTVSRETGTKVDNKQKYFDAITQTIGDYAQIMPIATRTEIISYLRGLPPVNDGPAVAVERVVENALMSTECIGLCRIE